MISVWFGIFGIFSSPSDWGGNEDDSRSTSGYAFTFGSEVFSWASVKQQSVALSTAEAEYVSASKATAQAIWLKFILKDFGELQVEATPLLCDNTSVIAMTKNSVFHQRTKNIKRRYYFIREALQDNTIKLIYCSTEDQIADIFTKVLPNERFNYIRGLLGLTPRSLEGVLEAKQLLESRDRRQQEAPKHGCCLHRRRKKKKGF